MTKSLLQWILLLYYLNGSAICEEQTKNLRVVHKLVGGHITLSRDDDAELMTLGAGEGKSSKKTKDKDKEEKKTLAQQVADGKYALIQTELFSKPIKKPGLISYRENSEVPHDNIANLGGLNKSDIWLSENHLLVIKGGSYPPYNSQNLDGDIWPSIDDYKAPRRQVKLPARPKVPPPFPVQLEDGGPLLLLGTNATKTLNGSFESGIYPVYPEENYVPGSEQPEPPAGYPPSYRDKANATAGEAPFPIPPFVGPGLDHYDPTKEGPLNNNNNGNLPFFPFINPADFPNLDNITYDEDDPSIYYPPPYSFYYRQDNTTEVPPGPLVPGIVLPPPPNFFAPLEEENQTKSVAPSSSEKPITTTESNSNQYNFTTSKPHRVTPTTAKKYPTITILKAITSAVPQRPKKPKTIVTTSRVPLKGYYTTTQFEPISLKKHSKDFIKELVFNIPRLTTPRPSIPPVVPDDKGPPRGQYYFYDENSINTTPRLRKQNYFIPPINEEHPQPEQPRQYYYINNKNDYPRRPADTFSIHIARLKDQIHTYRTALRNDNDFYHRPIYNKPLPKPLYQYSFESVNYPNQQRQQQLPRHYDIEIQEAIEVTQPTPIYETTQEDTFYYPETVTENPRKKQSAKSHSRPISEYSFEATPNPIFQQLYTKHDEPYIDDVTKEYFTSFGKKLPVATTPIPTKYVNTRTEDDVRNRPISLERDTLINYLHSRPAINPNAEFLPKYDRTQPYEQGYPRYRSTVENIEEERPPYISYKLPGDEGTHFYFITPKLAQKRQQNSSYFYQ